MTKIPKFKPVNPKQDFVKMENNLLKYWREKGVVDKYLKRNAGSKKRYSFLDGPITANNPMGVHHAWGRTYKDLYQRYFNMKGYAQRFQNGFDEQGLWIEVEVEKELGFKSKKDIEKFGIEKFVNLCKERVKKYSKIQTEQSKRLGYFMNWQKSYHTSSDENNYAIWNFLKVCNQKGYLYKGRDSVPWCPRCGTAISQHEILTEEYKEITHKAVYIKYKLQDTNSKFKNNYLLVWTTTPWTLPSNVAIAVNSQLDYGVYDVENQSIILAIERAKAVSINQSPHKKFKGKELINLKYDGIFDKLQALKGVTHKIVAENELVTAEEGTGLVHIAPGAGEEDFAISKKENLSVIESIDEEANYIEGFEDLTGKNAKKNPNLIIEKLIEGKVLFKQENYKHRYPTCWRCKTELVWRVVDEWYIAMDKKDPDDKRDRTLRQEMISVAKKIKWFPKFGLDRELDWLKNMHDWLISKKRYWGLALPIWECNKCSNFEVFGSKQELKKKAVNGWQDFEARSPHRPHIDKVTIKCPKCNSLASRIPDVGNVWLDAGIVPISTMPTEWFPADFITESFPGQFKNWFYSMIAMSTVLKNTNPYNTVLGFATLLDENGQEMHKSKGNAIEFNQAADKIGVDVMRWMYLKHNPTNNLLFGYHKADDVRRRFYLILWNIYSFFITYANLDNWKPEVNYQHSETKKNTLDNWIISRFNLMLSKVNTSLENYEANAACEVIENFVIDNLSAWYVRRSRDRLGIAADDLKDKQACYETLNFILVNLSKVSAPFMPFISEEIYVNLTKKESVHLSQWPNTKQVDNKIDKEMTAARKITEKAHFLRKEAGIKVRMPLQKITYSGIRLSKGIESILAEEINVKTILYKKNSQISLDTNLTKQLKTEGQAREIIRQIQQMRKEAMCQLDEKIETLLPYWPKEFEEEIKKQTLTKKLIKNSKASIRRF